MAMAMAIVDNSWQWLTIMVDNDNGWPAFRSNQLADHGWQWQRLTIVDNGWPWLTMVGNDNGWQWLTLVDHHGWQWQWLTCVLFQQLCKLQHKLLPPCWPHLSKLSIWFILIENKSVMKYLPLARVRSSLTPWWKKKCICQTFRNHLFPLNMGYTALYTTQHKSGQ